MNKRTSDREFNYLLKCKFNIKFIILVIAIAAAFFAAVCGCQYKDDNNNPGMLMGEDKNYKLYVHKSDVVPDLYSYIIFDNDGKELFSDQVVREPNIRYVGENIIEIMIGWGTDSWSYTYYDVQKGIISEEFKNVRICFDGKIAFGRNDSTGLWLIVRDIFNKNTYYKEFEFKADYNYMIQATTAFELIEPIKRVDGDVLVVVYLYGDEQELKCELVHL